MDRRMDVAPAQMLLLSWGALLGSSAWCCCSCGNPATSHPRLRIQPQGDTWGRAGHRSPASACWHGSPASVVLCWFIRNEGLIPRSYSQNCKEYLYFSYSVPTFLCCHPPSLCSSLIPFQLCFLMGYLKFDMGPPFWPRIPSHFCFWKQNLHFQQHSSKALSQPEPRKGGPHVPHLCTHQESLSLCSPSWRRSMKRSSLKFYLDFWELEKLVRSLFFLLLWMMMKPFKVIGFESFFFFPFPSLDCYF